MSIMLRPTGVFLLGFLLVIPTKTWGTLLAPSSPEATGRLIGIEALSPTHQTAVQRLLEAEPLYMRITTSPFRTTLRIYDYLLARLPLAATLGRLLALGPYIIEHTGPGTFRGTDQQNLSGTFREIGTANGHRVYLGRGRYDGQLFRGVTGRVLIVFRYEPLVLDDGQSAVANTVHCLVRLDNAILHALARVFGSVIHVLIEAKLQRAITVAKNLSERLAADPQAVYQAMTNSPSITREERAEFTRWFLQP